MCTEFRTTWHNEDIIPFSLLNRFLIYFPGRSPHLRENLSQFPLYHCKTRCFSRDIPFSSRPQDHVCIETGTCPVFQTFILCNFLFKCKRITIFSACLNIFLPIFQMDRKEGRYLSHLLTAFSYRWHCFCCVFIFGKSAQNQFVNKSVSCF